MKHRNSIAIGPVIKVLQGAARSGADIPALLADLGISRTTLEDSTARIERDTFLKLMLV